MSDLIFVLKCLILTFVAAVIMQMKVNGLTIETHMRMTASSPAIQTHLTLAARGATQMARQASGYAIKASEDVVTYVKSLTTSSAK
jgi:hypothetical protein